MPAYPQLHEDVRALLRRGVVIPAHPLALSADRKLDERRQRALARYYAAAGAGGIAVGVHTTQFRIRDPQLGLYKPVLAIAAEEMDRADAGRGIVAGWRGSGVPESGSASAEPIALRP